MKFTWFQGYKELCLTTEAPRPLDFYQSSSGAAQPHQLSESLLSRPYVQLGTWLFCKYNCIYIDYILQPVISLRHRLFSSKIRKDVYTLNGFLKHLEEIGTTLGRKESWQLQASGSPKHAVTKEAPASPHKGLLSRTITESEANLNHTVRFWPACARVRSHLKNKRKEEIHNFLDSIKKRK